MDTCTSCGGRLDDCNESQIVCPRCGDPPEPRTLTPRTSIHASAIWREAKIHPRRHRRLSGQSDGRSLLAMDRCLVLQKRRWSCPSSAREQCSPRLLSKGSCEASQADGCYGTWMAMEVRFNPR